MIRWIETFDVFKLLLFVDVDKDAVIECVPETGSFHLAWLEYSVAVRENDCRPPLLYMLHRLQSARIYGVGERVIDQPARHAQYVWAMDRLDSEALQCPQVIDVS